MTTITTTNNNNEANSPLGAYFACLLEGNALLVADNITIVSDNAKSPDETLTKTRQKQVQQQEEESSLEPDERFTFLPSRWETNAAPAAAQQTSFVKPCQPKRQVSIEYPIGGGSGNPNNASDHYDDDDESVDDDADADDDDASTELSFNSDYSINSSSSSSGLVVNNRELLPPPIPTRWTTNNKLQHHQQPALPPKFPQRPGTVIRSDSLNSLSSSSTHSTNSIPASRTMSASWNGSITLGGGRRS